MANSDEKNKISKYCKTSSQKIPEFKGIYEQHLKDQGGKVLLHVLFGDFTRFVIKQFSDLQKNENAKDIFLRCVEFIEIDNLVAASFLENLHQPNYYYGLIKLMKPYFGPKTLELLKSMVGDDVSQKKNLYSIV